MSGNHAVEILNKCNPRNAEPNIQLRMFATSGHRSDHLIGWITFVILFKFVCLQQLAGDWCTFQRTNETGWCKLVSDCPKAIEDLRSQNIFPQQCGFEGTLPIVCCETSYSENPSTEAAIVPVVTKTKQKCQEYSDGYNTQVSITYIPGIDHLIQETCVHSHGLLLEGNEARPKEFPQMAAIGYDGENKEKLWKCSGALISEKFILTAAHCLSSSETGAPKYVRIGDLNLDNDDDDANPQEFKVARIFKHPEFKAPSFYSDIGLLELDEPVNFTLYARPACLNTNSTLTSPKLIAAAWGDDSSHLSKQTLKLVSHAECERLYKDTIVGRTLKGGIVDQTQVCAGLRNNHAGCVDGTGPLLTYNKEGHCMYNIVGITSFSRSCRNPELPDVFTRVSAYIPWIEEIVWPS